MRRLDRYILSEIIGPLALGFFVYTFILLLQALFKSAELIITSGVETATVGRLLLLSLPWIVVMTIPMSFLFGILIAIGRLSADSELVAIRASGISLFSLYRPILLLSLLLTGINVYLMVDVLPEGNHALQQLRIDILTQSLTDEVEPRVPHTGWQNKVLYVFEAPPGERRWHGTFLADAIPTNQENEMVVAEWGQARSDGTGILLTLQNAFTHVVDLAHPEQYKLAYYDEIDIKLATLPQQAAQSVQRGLRELSIRELYVRAGDASYPESVRHLAWVEIHKKLSIPAACMVFGLLGLPLGFTTSRGGRSSGFAISIGVILIYYVMLNSGEDFAREGTLPPWLAVWLPNLVLLAIGMFLLARRNRDKSLLLTHIDRWVREQLWERILNVQQRREARKVARREALSAARRGGRVNVVVRLPELRLRFPNLVDRYILRVFFRILVLAILSGTVVYLVADLTDNVDDILEHQVPHSVVFDYYKYKAFAIVYEISPVIVLVTTLVTFGLLSRTNEITACKALGMSLYRLSVPALIGALAVAGTAGILQSEVLAASNSKVVELHAQIKGQESPQRANLAHRRWLYGKGNLLFNFAYYDEKEQELHRLQVFRFDDSYRLIGRLMVRRAKYLEGGWWMFTSGWARTWNGSEETSFIQFDEPMKYHLEDGPEYFAGGLRRPDEMNYAELHGYIEELKATGQDVPQLEVALYSKVTYPVISLVMALVALPFAFRLGRQGALYGIGLSLVLGVILLIVLSIFNALGGSGVLPPLVAVWSPSLIFAIFSLYLFLGVRT